MTSYSSFSITALLAYLATNDAIFQFLAAVKNSDILYYICQICTYIVYTYIDCGSACSGLSQIDTSESINLSIYFRQLTGQPLLQSITGRYFSPSNHLHPSDTPCLNVSTSVSYLADATKLIFMVIQWQV